MCRGRPHPHRRCPRPQSMNRLCRRRNKMRWTRGLAYCPSPMNFRNTYRLSMRQVVRTRHLRQRSTLRRTTESIRSQAMNNAHAAYLLKRATHASGSAARRLYMRAYYVNVAERMRQLDPKLNASINAYEEAKIRDIGEEKGSVHVTHH